METLGDALKSLISDTKTYRIERPMGANISGKKGSAAAIHGGTYGPAPMARVRFIPIHESI